MPASKVGAVDFLVDGKVVWIERHPPYTYGLDGNWLVTSWLAPGEHRFTTRLVTTSGVRAEDTVSARTLAPSRPPAAIVGTWRAPDARAGGPTRPPGFGR